MGVTRGFITLTRRCTIHHSAGLRPVGVDRSCRRRCLNQLTLWRDLCARWTARSACATECGRSSVPTRIASKGSPQRVRRCFAHVTA
jgi:hypothetical protein